MNKPTFKLEIKAPEQLFADGTLRPVERLIGRPKSEAKHGRLINLRGESRIEDRLIAQSRIHGWKERETIKCFEIVLVPGPRYHRLYPVKRNSEHIVLDVNGVARVIQNYR